jgi:hypothetical protein
MNIFSIPYYRRDQYALLREKSLDKETFAISYDEMIATTESKRLEIENGGFKVIKVDIDVIELIEWAATQELPINPESRTRFAMIKLKEKLFG